MTSGLWLLEATNVCRRLHLTARADMPPFRSSGGVKTDSAVRNIRAPGQKYPGWRRCREPCGTQRPLLAPLSRRSTPPMMRYPSAVPWMHRQPQSPRPGAPIAGAGRAAAASADLDLFGPLRIYKSQLPGRER